MKALAGIAASIVTFTRMPFPWTLSEAAFPKASWHLPFIGWLLLLPLAFVLRWTNLPDDGVVFFCLLLPVLLTGAMHEDGLADAADGLIGGQTREKRLAIMKDPRVGSYAVISLCLCFLGQFLAIRALPPDYRLTAFAFVLPMSRCIASLLLQALPYARADEIRAGAYLSRSFWGVIWPLLWTLPAFFFVSPGTRWLLLGCSIALFFGLGFYFRRKLGGVTGDCLGAAVKIAELSLFWIFTVIVPAA